jgi:hypothetical protein
VNHILIGCGKSKRDTRSLVVELYTGPLYTARLALARAMQCGRDPWILSALHGVLRPRATIAPYDVTVSGLTRVERVMWAGGVCEWMATHTAPGDTVLVLAGDDYVKPWGAIVGGTGRLVVQPFRGLGIGEQKRALRLALDAYRGQQLALDEVA